jgi:hypothetical protein
MELVKIFVIPLSIAILGYLVKLFSDLLVRRREKRFQLLERQLSEFYWPIYIRLHNNRAVWFRILSKGELYDTVENNMARSIETNVILKNHVEIVDILKSSIHVVFPDDKLIEATKLYLKHVEIYKALKDSDVHDIFPDKSCSAYSEHLWSALQ